jgi:hypothetical protein
MSIQVVEVVSVTEQHLDPNEVVAYVDRVATPSSRARIESHLATCAECRAEVSDAARIIATLPPARGRRRRIAISAAGIAAMLLIFLWPRANREPLHQEHREAPITTTIAPVVLTPVGPVESANAFSWSSVPHADRYDVRVFDADGSVVWQRGTTDTTLVAPRDIGFRAGRPYYWKVEAHTGFDRSTASELVEFSIRGSQPR